MKEKKAYYYGDVIATNFTMVPNKIFDMIPDLKLSDYAVLMIIIRNTIGWHRKSAMLSISKICKLTGISKPTVVSAIKNLNELNVISTTKQFGEVNKYTLEIELEENDKLQENNAENTEQENEQPGYNNFNNQCAKYLTPPVKILYNQGDLNYYPETNCSCLNKGLNKDINKGLKKEFVAPCATLSTDTKPRNCSKKAKPKIAEKNIDYQKVVSAYFDTHETVTGNKPVFGGAEGKLLKKLLSVLSADEIIYRLTRYYTLDFWFTKQGYSFRQFYTHIDELVTDPVTITRKKRHENNIEPWENPGYYDNIVDDVKERWEEPGYYDDVEVLRKASI